MKSPKHPTAAIYARVSTLDQNLDSQLQECREWCQRAGIEVREFKDKASGSLSSRTALDAMMKEVRDGRIKIVVCYKMDRLGRSLQHLAQVVGEFNSHGVALVCPSQGIDTRADSPSARLQMHVLMAIAEFERSLIKERTLAGLKDARARGVQLGRPKGTRRRWPLTEARAWLAEGKSLRAFARMKGVTEASLRRHLKRTQE